MPGWVSPWEFLLLVFVILVVFVPKRLPAAGRSLGRGLRGFKTAVTSKLDDEPELPAPREDDTV